MVRKSLNFSIFATMGFFAELIFLGAMQLPFSLTWFLNAFIMAFFFMVYRFFMDWRYFTNKGSKLLKDLQTGSDLTESIAFAFMLAYIMMIVNYNFVTININSLILALMTVIFTKFLVEGIRLTTNYAYSLFQGINKTKGRANSWQQI